MQSLLRFCSTLDRVIQAIGKAASLLLLALMAVIVFDVASRGTAWTNSTRLQELEWHIHAAICFLTFAYTMTLDRHVRVEVFRDHWSAKRKAAVDLLGLLFLFLPMVLVALYYSVLFANNSFMSAESSPSATGLSYRWIIKSFQPAGFALLLLAGLTRCVRQTAILTGHTPPTKPATQALIP